MDPLLVWGIALLAAALVLFALELFIPSGGLLGVVAGVAAVAGGSASMRTFALAVTSATFIAVTVRGAGPRRREAWRGQRSLEVGRGRKLNKAHPPRISTKIFPCAKFSGREKRIAAEIFRSKPPIRARRG